MIKRNVIRLWCIAQISAYVLCWLTFFTLAPWLSAISLEDTVKLYGTAVHLDCPAIVVNHGHFSCFGRGTVASNPWGFGLWILLSVAGFAFLAFSNIKSKGFFCEKILEVVRLYMITVTRKLGLDELGLREPNLKQVKNSVLGGLSILVGFCVILLGNLIPKIVAIF